MGQTSKQQIIVDRRSERGFRRRAIRALPFEYQECLWGREHGGKIYIHAFVPMNQTATPTALFYDDEEIPESAEEAREHNLMLLGTIHSHPGRAEVLFSETDLREHLLDPDRIIGICAIKEVWNGENFVRHQCAVGYWPGVLPLTVTYTNK